MEMKTQKHRMNAFFKKNLYLILTIAYIYIMLDEVRSPSWVNSANYIQLGYVLLLELIKRLVLSKDYDPHFES